MSPAEPVERAHELAHEGRFMLLTRLGFFGRGALYILIALLALRVGRTEDLTGALEYLNNGSGRLLLAGIAVGMLAYGLWRLADAASGMEHPGSGNKVMAKRAAAGIAGIIYLYLCYKSARLLFADERASGNAQQQAETVLDLPGGAAILALAALVLAIAGVMQIRTASKCSFLACLDARAQAPLVKWLGRIGYAARGVIFLTVSWMIGKAALDGDPSKAGGMEQALDFFSGPILYAVALGLLLFGAFSIVEALYRRIHEPPADELKRELSDKLST